MFCSTHFRDESLQAMNCTDSEREKKNTKKLKNNTWQKFHIATSFFPKYNKGYR